MRVTTLLFCLLLSPGLFLSVSNAYAWSRHDLLTLYALDSRMPALSSELIAPEKIETFTEKEKQGLSALFDSYYTYVSYLSKYSYVSHRGKNIHFDPAHAGIAEFIRAARINPEQRFKLEGMKTNALQILASHADEPDQGMDQDLWMIADYGFGNPPYGPETGKNSQAPFHMQFMDEGIILRLSAPEISRGMAYERMALYLRLARFAFGKGHPYWGYRFTAWALHYLEDICQPYHAKAAPQASLGYYLKFLFSSDKAAMKSEATREVRDNHFAYEDFAAALFSMPEVQAVLAKGRENYSYQSDYMLFREMAYEAADSAPAVDALVRQRHSPGTDTKLRELTMRIYEKTGVAIRTLIKMARG